RHLREFGAGDGLAVGEGRVVGDNERGGGASAGHTGLDVHVVELGGATVRHLLGERPQRFGRGVVMGRRGVHEHGLLERAGEVAQSNRRSRTGPGSSADMPVASNWTFGRPVRRRVRPSRLYGWRAGYRLGSTVKYTRTWVR